ncbi:unnamed protein product [Effrenium voratum]|nr:unnamed protein product [Effrenium voratum]
MRCRSWILLGCETGVCGVLVRCLPEEVKGANSGCLCVEEPPQLWSENTAFEGCAAEARRVDSGPVAFQLGPGAAPGSMTCVPLSCLPCRGTPPALPPTQRRTFATRPLCSGAPVIVTDAALAAQEVEFVQTFGAMRGQLRSLRGECSSQSQRVVAEVCNGEVCDEWSKYAQPRCRIMVGFPYDPQHMSFLTAHACASLRQLYCPPNVPIAIRATLKAASRSTGLWAAMIEGLLPALVAIRRAITASLQEASLAGGISDAVFKRFGREWIEHETFRLGCTQEYWERNLNSIVSRHLHDQLPMLALPLGLCPTCCKHGTGRLQVVVMRNPFARLASYWRDWRGSKGHLAPNITFQEWLDEILSDQPNRSLISARDEFHVEPAFNEPPTDEVVFLVEEPLASLRRVEQRLCALGACVPLPAFPAGAEGARTRRAQVPGAPGRPPQLAS